MRPRNTCTPYFTRAELLFINKAQYPFGKIILIPKSIFLCSIISKVICSCKGISQPFDKSHILGLKVTKGAS